MNPGAYNRENNLVGAIGIVRSAKDEFNVKDLHPEEQKLVNNFRKTCYISTLIVAPDFRKKGIATQLLQRGTTRLAQKGSQLVYLHVLHSNIPAIRLYEKLGFERVADVPNYYTINGARETGIIYSKVEVIIERTFAFYFVADYEKKPRLWISTSILAVTLPITLLVTVMMLIRIIPIKIIIIADCVMTLLFLIIFVVLYRLNVLRLHELRAGIAHCKTKNTLSTKFQLLENVRVMRLAMIAFTVGSTLTFIGVGLFALALLVYYDQPEARQLCLVLLDLLVALSTAVGFFAFLLIFNEWRQAIREWPLALKLCHILRIQLNEPCQNIDDHRGATDHYFNQLRRAWE
ncbi:unnamed protein product [Haemonchus placei]|uniref:N-acetyltransferase domain-containing protein n=1 Tax=Haemonchus placei TaxID=6290 RepID=A0A3P8CIC8_HAEPC|nr:unnamed protein product [Haemonchus placei]